MAQLALAWVVRQPGVTSPIIGPRTMEHLLDNLGALDVAFSEEDFTAIDALVPPGAVADVQSGQVANCDGSHRHSPGFHGAVHLFGAGTFQQ